MFWFLPYHSSEISLMKLPRNNCSCFNDKTFHTDSTHVCMREKYDARDCQEIMAQKCIIRYKMMNSVSSENLRRRSRIQYMQRRSQTWVDCVDTITCHYVIRILTFCNIKNFWYLIQQTSILFDYHSLTWIINNIQNLI